jgi:hypothetical protein
VPVAASASHVAFSALRMEPHWMAMGISCGAAAALAIQQQTELHDLKPSSINGWQTVKRSWLAKNISYNKSMLMKKWHETIGKRRA